MTTRRALLISSGILAMPQIAWTQQAQRSYRLGWIATSDNRNEPYGQAFMQRLAELGLVEGRNLSIIHLHAAGRLEKLPELAAELVKQKPNVLFGGGTEANLVALKQATPDTPIVFVAVDFDPLAAGHVASLARPGSRITGVTAVQSELPAKRLELLRELLPRVRKVAVFTNEQTTQQLEVAQDAAKRFGLALHIVDFKRPPFDYEAGFADAVRANADALLVTGSGLWVPARRKIPELALKAKLPSVFHQSQWAEVGGLMSYGFSFPEMWRRGAEMVARILRGANPGEIPMEQPSVYELALNMRTAKALGIKIPPAFQTRVNKVFE